MNIYENRNPAHLHKSMIYRVEDDAAAAELPIAAWCASSARFESTVKVDATV